MFQCQSYGHDCPQQAPGLYCCKFKTAGLFFSFLVVATTILNNIFITNNV